MGLACVHHQVAGNDSSARAFLSEDSLSKGEAPGNWRKRQGPKVESQREESPLGLGSCHAHTWVAFPLSSLTLVMPHSSAFSLNPGRPTVLSCLGLRRGPPGYKTFSAKLGKLCINWDKLVTLLESWHSDSLYSTISPKYLGQFTYQHGPHFPPVKVTHGSYGNLMS